jgi:hypothetical protein
MLFGVNFLLEQWHVAKEFQPQIQEVQTTQPRNSSHNTKKLKPLNQKNQAIKTRNSSH